jgi:hypothetical protein
LIIALTSAIADYRDTHYVIHHLYAICFRSAYFRSPWIMKTAMIPMPYEATRGSSRLMNGRYWLCQYLPKDADLST